MSSEERFDLLLEKYLDGALAAGEESELRDLLGARPELRARFVASLTQEAALRKIRPAELTASARFDLRTVRTVESPGGASSGSSRRALATPRHPQRAKRRLEVGWMPVTLAASVALIATAYLVVSRPLPVPVARVAVAEIARVASIRMVEGQGSAPGFTRGGHEFPLVADLKLRPGDAVNAQGGVVGLEYLGEGTSLELKFGTSLAFKDATGKHLHLASGEVRATVARQPAGQMLRIVTPQAQAIVVGTRFGLSVRGDLTRLEVTEGCVRLARENGESLDVTAGRIALATADGQLAFMTDARFDAAVSPETAKATEPAQTRTPTSVRPRLSPAGGRAFTDASPWNAALPRQPVLDPANDASVGLLGRRVSIALYAYSVPVYEADERTPVRRVVCSKPWGASPFSGWDVRVPDGATPNTGTNGSLMVIDWHARRTWEFYRFEWRGPDIHCAWGGHVGLDGSGVDSDYTGAAGGSWLGGLIRVREMEQGRIEHALIFGSMYAKKEVRFPGRKPDGDYTGPGGIPVGTRVQLDPAIDVGAIPGLAPAETAIAVALQKYGAYCVGRTQNFSMMFFAERAPDATGTEHPGAVYQAKGLVRDSPDLSRIPWGSLRVMRQWDGK